MLKSAEVCTEPDYEIDSLAEFGAQIQRELLTTPLVPNGKPVPEINTSSLLLGNELPLIIAPHASMTNSEVVAHFLPSTEPERTYAVSVLCSLVSSAAKQKFDKKSETYPQTFDHVTRAVVLLEKFKCSSYELALDTTQQILRAESDYLQRIKPWVKTILDDIRIPNAAISHEDLVQEGLLALVHSLSRYDLAEINVSPLNFCKKRVVGAAKDYLRKINTTIHIPRKAIQKARKFNDLPNTMTPEQKAKIIGVDVSEIAEIGRFALLFAVLPLNKNGSGISGNRDEEQVFLDRTISDAEELALRTIGSDGADVIALLKPYLREVDINILTLYFGLGDQKSPMKMSEVGKVFGYSESWASLHIKHSIQEIRRQCADNPALKSAFYDLLS